MNCLLLHKARVLHYQQVLHYWHVLLQELLSNGNKITVIRNTRVKMILPRVSKIKIGKKMFKFSKTLKHQSFEW